MSNKIKIGNTVIEFNFEIKDTINNGNQLILLLEIPYTHNELNNVYAYNENGELLWRVNTRFHEYGIRKKLPFEMIKLIDNKLFATDFYGRSFNIDLNTGVTSSYNIVK